jgi:hypothetical protein
MPNNTAIDVLKDQVTTDMMAGNTTEFYFEIPGYPAFGFHVDLVKLISLLSDSENKIHEAVGIVGSNQLPGMKDTGTRGPCFSIPLYDMDQLSDILRKQDTRPA